MTLAISTYRPPTVTNLNGTFQQHLPHILDLVGWDPALFFLDPFGYKGMDWGALQQVAARARQSSRAKTELLVNFNVGLVDRGAG
jgi:three-Cys-motif partner protein